MEIIFNKPKYEPYFIATIYTRGNNLEYRVNIGKEATDTGMDNDEMPVGDYVAESGFLKRKGIEKWIYKQVSALKKEGKKVEFDDNFSYMMTKAIEELVQESPIRT